MDTTTTNDSTRRMESSREHSKRRMSVLDRTSVVVTDIKQTMDELNEMWDEVDMDEATRLTRVNTAYGHVYNLLNEMKSAERSMVTIVKEQCATFEPKVNDMRKELGMPAFAAEDYKPHSLKLWKALETDLKELKASREVLLQEQLEITEKFEKLAFRLGQDISDISSVSIPTGAALAPRRVVAELRTRAASMEKELAQRMATLKRAKGDLEMWTKRMKRSCEVSDDVRTVLEADVDDEEFAVTKSFLDSVTSMHAEMEAEYSEWINGLQYEYDEEMVKLQDLWVKNFISPAEQILPLQFDSSFNSTITERRKGRKGQAAQTMDAVEKVRAEVDRLTELYTRRRPVLEKVEEWRTLWNEKVEYEAQSDAEKYKKLGNIQTTLKRQEALEKRLIPGAAAAVERTWNEYRVENGRDRFLIEGMDPHAFVLNEMQEYAIAKQMEKDNRAAMRKEQRELEQKFGVKEAATMRTPLALRRKLPSSAASCSKLGGPASKVPRVVGGDVTTNQELSRFFGNSSIISSLISPTRAHKMFPKTSSPKGSRVTVTPQHRLFNAPSGHAAGVTKTPGRPAFRPVNRKL